MLTGASACEHDDAALFHHACPAAAGDERAGVHALLIGVSAYRRRFPGRGVMPNLPGTAAAAVRFARFLTDEYCDPGGVPLRTVRVLLSLIDKQEQYLRTDGRPWQEADYESVRFALDDWLDDCDRDPGNIAVLYVAAHGVSTPNDGRWAFLSAAGATKEPYAFALNLAAIKDEMRSRQARSNIFVWDVCALRGADIPLQRLGDVGLTLPIRPPGEVGTGAVNQVTIAARLGTRTYSLSTTRGTVLSNALVGDDSAAQRSHLLHTAGQLAEDGRWLVTPGQLERLLPEAMRQLTDARLAGEEPVVRSDDRTAGINRPQPPPEFPLELHWLPTADGAALDVLVTGKDGTPAAQCRLSGDPVRVSVPAGRYTVVVTPVAGTAGREREYPLVVGKALRITAYDGSELP